MAGEVILDRACAAGQRAATAHANAPLSLRTNFAWTLAGNFVYTGCQWGMTVALAKLGDPTMVGQFALGMAVCGPVLILTSLGLRAVQATDARRRFPFSDFLYLRLAMTGLALLAIAVALRPLGYSGTTALIILAIGLAKCVEAISEVFYGLLQQNERMDRISKSMILKGPSSLLAVGVVVYLTHSVLWGAVAMAVVWALVLFAYDIPSGARLLSARPAFRDMLRARPALGALGQLAWLALPLGVAQMLLSLNTNIPRYFIESWKGEYDLGIFAALASLMTAGFTVLGALGNSASPRLAGYYARGQSRAFVTLFLKLQVIAALAGFAGIMVAWLAGRPLLTIVFRPEYAAYSDVLVWLMVAAALIYLTSFFGHALTACHYFKYQAVLLAMTATLTALACAMLVPAYGLRGAAWAMGGVSLAHLCGLVFPMLHAVRAMNAGSYVAPDDAAR